MTENIDAAVEERIFGLGFFGRTPEELGAAVSSGLRFSHPLDDMPGFAVLRYRWDGHDFDLLSTESRWNYGWAHGNDGYGLWYWEHREDEPWQTAIEAHVAAWRRPAPRYSTDYGTAFRIVDHLKSTHDFDLHVDSMEVQAIFSEMVVPPRIRDAVADTVPMAICLAALKLKDNS